jgi:plasmid replication initiation protein
MATVWDYDMVIMATSYFTEAMNKFRKGKGTVPPNLFRPNVNDIMKFCRRGKGGNQHDSLLNGLKRLADTTVLISNMPVYENGEKKYLNKQASLINTFSMLTNAKTGKVEHVEFELPTFMYEEITKSGTPSVLTSQARVAPPGRSTWCSSAAVAAANARS